MNPHVDSSGIQISQGHTMTRGTDGSRDAYGLNRSGKQRVTITLPVALLERLRNAVYWSGQGSLARLISDALLDAVSELEEANGGRFPARLAPLKRGRPKLPHHNHLP